MSGVRNTSFECIGYPVGVRYLKMCYSMHLGHMLLKIGHGILSGTCHSSFYEVQVDVLCVRNTVPVQRVGSETATMPPTQGILSSDHLMLLLAQISCVLVCSQCLTHCPTSFFFFFLFHLHLCLFTNINYNALTSECQLLSTINLQFRFLFIIHPTHTD